MEAVYGWVKNIIYYMIFLSVVNNLLADSKYGKYIRFFSGMVLILLVVSPFTGGLHLDEQISSMFKSISFQNDTDDLKQDLWGMEERRLDQVIREYEQAVAADVEAMARAEGLECTGASVQIDGDRNSSRYGQIEGIGLVISAGGLKGAMEHLGVPITELEVEDPGIYLDADTPQDYMNLRYWNDYSQIQKQGPKMIHFRISIGMTS